MQFTDYVHTSVERTNSVLVAGLDPVLDSFPEVFLTEAAKPSSHEESLYCALTGYYGFALQTLAGRIAAIKPNIAFFEQYGIGGLRALQYVLQLARDLQIPSILDAKRGDIGTTAEAYAKAYLSGVSYKGTSMIAFDADSLTVNPFLGFDTVKVFVDACKDSGKGIFVLVKTSNPGSKDLQDRITESGRSISETLTEWINRESNSLIGTHGMSGLGSVVGATHPSQMKELRAKMPTSLFLIPGMGAQGGTAKDVMGGFVAPRKGALINMSRGLLSAFSRKDLPVELLNQELLSLAARYNDELSAATKETFGEYA